MQTIPRETIETIWDRVEDTSEAEALAMANRMKDQQPFIMVYLLATEENLFPDEEPGYLMEFGAVIFEVMTSANSALQQVTDVDLEAAEATNIKFLEEMAEESEMNLTDTMRSLVKDYNQMPLLGALLEVLMQGNEDTPELADENMGLVLLHLKTVIDCLDQ